MNRINEIKLILKALHDERIITKNGPRDKNYQWLLAEIKNYEDELSAIKLHNEDSDDFHRY